MRKIDQKIVEHSANLSITITNVVVSLFLRQSSFQNRGNQAVEPILEALAAVLHHLEYLHPFTVLGYLIPTSNAAMQYH